ncbi:MAG: hypothetical protein ACOZFS_05705 [Thermodesulfobacteriota bacterium]
MHESKKNLEPADAWLWGSGQGWRRIALVLMILLLPGLLGAWRIVSGETIDPRHVERIKDGKTTKHEILTLFGDPQEIDRTPDGVTYTYKSFKDAPAMPYKHHERQINTQSDQLYVIDENKQVKKAPLKTEGKILKSTLVIQFKRDGETVLSHEYKQF